MGLERQGGGKSGDGGLFAAWVVPARLGRSPRALLAVLRPIGCYAAQRGPKALRAGGPRAARPRFIPRTLKNQQGER